MIKILNEGRGLTFIDWIDVYLTVPDDCEIGNYYLDGLLDYEEHWLSYLELFRRNKIKKIITPSPQCAYTFSKLYGIKTEHVTQTILKHQDKIPLKHEELKDL